MNTQPHSHVVIIHDRGDYWALSYGDQTEVPSKPSRWFFESATHYSRRLSSTLKNHVAKTIRKHDKESKRAIDINVIQEAIFVLRPDEWGSDQLGRVGLI